MLVERVGFHLGKILGNVIGQQFNKEREEKPLLGSHQSVFHKETQAKEKFNMRLEIIGILLLMQLQGCATAIRLEYSVQHHMKGEEHHHTMHKKYSATRSRLVKPKSFISPHNYQTRNNGQKDVTSMHHQEQ